MAYERFWAKVNTAGDCWLWTGALTKGYGQLTHEKRHLYAHRFSWEIANGSVPTGHVVCHRCDTPTCVRPSHLFVATQLENVADCIRKGRTNRRGVPGPENSAVKQTSIDVDRIRRLASSGVGVREIAPLVGVSKSTVSNILRGKHWSVSHGL